MVDPPPIQYSRPVVSNQQNEAVVRCAYQSLKRTLTLLAGVVAILLFCYGLMILGICLGYPRRGQTLGELMFDAGSGLSPFFWLALLALLCAYSYQANSLVRSLGQPLVYSPSMAALSYLIPLLNFVLPFLVLKEIFAGSIRIAKLGQQETRTWIEAWWVSMVIARLAGPAWFILYGRSGTLDYFSIVLLLNVFALLLLAKWVHSIIQLQTASNFGVVEE